MTVDQKISPSKGKETFQPREQINQNLAQNQRSLTLPSTFISTNGAASGIVDWNARQHDKSPKQYVVHEQLPSTTDAHLDLKQPNLPKLKLPDFLGKPIEGPEWSSLFPATVDSAGIDNSHELNDLKILRSGEFFWNA